MKYRNKETGVLLEPRSEAVAARLANDPAFELFDARQQAEDRPLERLNKAELLALLAELGVAAPDKATNDDLRGLIRAARDA